MVHLFVEECLRFWCLLVHRYNKTVFVEIFLIWLQDSKLAWVSVVLTKWPGPWGRLGLSKGGSVFLGFREGREWSRIHCLCVPQEINRLVHVGRWSNKIVHHHGRNLYLGVTHQYNYHHQTCSRTRTSATGDEPWSSVSGGPSKNKGDLWSNTRDNNISVELLCQSPLGVLFRQGLLLFRGDHELLVIHTTSKAKRDSSSRIPSGLLAITFTFLAITFGVDQLAIGIIRELGVQGVQSVSRAEWLGSGSSSTSFHLPNISHWVRG